MDQKKKEALIRAAESLAGNAQLYAARAERQIEMLRRAKTTRDAAIAGQTIFDWILQIEEDKKNADAVFMRELGRMWEFD